MRNANNINDKKNIYLSLIAVLIVLLLLCLSFITCLQSFSRIREIKNPTAPKDLNANAIDNKTIELKWDTPSSSGSSSVIKYSIYRSITSGNETFYRNNENLTSLIYFDTNVIVGQTYYYRISASNKWGEGPKSNEANATIIKITVEYPTAPKDLNANTIDNKTIELKWNAPLSNGTSPIIKYSIYRNIISGNETFYRINENLTSLIYLDTNVIVGQIYYYRISASNMWGEGPLSNEANATISYSNPNSIRRQTWLPGVYQRPWESVLDSTGLYVVGTFEIFTASINQPYYNAFLLKYDLNGDLLWNRTWGPNDTMIEGIAVDSSGIYLSGATNILGVDGSVLLIKLDLNGNQIWNRTWGDVNPNGEKIGIALYSNIIYITGFYNYMPLTTKLFLLAYDSTGKYLWNRTWNYTYASEPEGIKINASAIYIIGVTVASKYGPWGLFLVKFDLSGNIIWSRLWNGSYLNNSNMDIFSRDFIVNSNAIYVVGRYQDNLTRQVYGFINVFDKNGNLMWNRTWTNDKQNEFDGIAIDSSAIYITETIISFYYRQVILLKLDLSGNISWNQTIDQRNNGLGSNIKMDSKCIYIDTVTADMTDIVYGDILFIKLPKIR